MDRENDAVESLPHDLEAEMGLLGAILLMPKGMDAVRDMIQGSDFYRQANGILYENLLLVESAGFPIGDIRVVASKLKQAGVFDQIGGVAYLAELTSMVPNASHAGYYAEIVAEKSRLRQIIAAATRAIESCRNPDADVFATHVVGTLEASLDMIGTEKTADIVSMEDAVGQIIERVEEGMARNESIGIPTGIAKLDEAGVGSFPGELNVIVARPSIGKTSMGFQLAKYASIHERSALFVSLEMEEWELGSRFIAGETEMDTTAMRAARVSEAEFDIMRKIKQECVGLSFFLWRPRKAVTIEQIRAGIKMLKSSTKGCDLVVIDYLQKIRGTNQKDARHEQLEHIIRASKDIASELSIPVTMLAQAKRAEKNRPPVLEDIKGSSAVEDEANNVWMIHREERHSTEARLIIAKARSGNTGDVTLGYDLKRTEFVDPGFD